ncbi:Holliday junction resolvase RuvX [Actinoplanes sp. NPDC051861]|uniref:Holliday junction resolvase RuvX n=1 Tax=Actinoplanes sp. NPDC051861 TaxID=3155170 RepID=UPI0034498F36
MTERFARGVRLGVDVGQVRVGVAKCDPDGILASPVVTVPRDREAGPDDVPADMTELARLAAEHEAIEIVVGLPVDLSGREGVAAGHIRAYVQRLTPVVAPRPVVLSDERMSTVVATRRLSERGVRGKRQRAVVDQAAAVEILQGWLNAQRRQSF